MSNIYTGDSVVKALHAKLLGLVQSRKEEAWRVQKEQEQVAKEAERLRRAADLNEID